MPFSIFGQILLRYSFEFFKIVEDLLIIQTKLFGCTNCELAARGKSKTGCFGFNEPRARVYKSIGQPVGRLANHARVYVASLYYFFFATVCFASRCFLTPCLPLARFTTEKIGRCGERPLCSLSKSHKISNGFVGATEIETLQFQLEDSMSQCDFFFPYTFREGIPHRGRLPLCNRRFQITHSCMFCK